MKKLILIIFFTFINKTFAFNTKAKQAILIDFESGQVLFKKNENEKAFPSSMTKIMTSYLIFEKLENGNLKLSDVFQVTNNAWKQVGSRTFLNIGSKVSIDELLKGMIIQSGNDASYSLAEGSSESIEEFVKEMNKKAKELKLENTHFTNPIGFSENGHYMSVKDTAILSKNLIKDFPQYYLKYFAIPEYKYNNILQQNRNTLAGKYEGVDGIKTGHTEAGGYSIAVSAFQNGRRLISVVNSLNSEYDRINETKKLLDYGFNNIEKFKLYNKDQRIKEVPVLYGKQKNATAITNEDIYVLAKNKDDIKTEIITKENLKAPILKNEIIGTLIVKTDFDEKSYDLYSAGNIKQVNIFKRFFLYLLDLLHK